MGSVFVEGAALDLRESCAAASLQNRKAFYLQAHFAVFAGDAAHNHQLRLASFQRLHEAHAEVVVQRLAHCNGHRLDGARVVEENVLVEGH